MAHVIEHRSTGTYAAHRGLTLADALDRLTSAGYDVDAHVWEQFVDGGLLRHSKAASASLTEVSTQDFKRFRELLDVRLKIGNRAPIDEMCFYACAANLPDVPATRVVAYMEAGLSAYFAACADALRSSGQLPDRLGLEGERELSARLAFSLLGVSAARNRKPVSNVERLLATCCMLFLHATWRNRTRGRGPAPRILTPALLESEDPPISTMSAGVPLRARAAETALPPATDLARLRDGLRRAAYDRSADVSAAAGDAARLVDAQFAGADAERLPIIVRSVAPLLAAAFVRVRTAAQVGVCERIIASAWTDPRAFQSALLAYWN